MKTESHDIRECPSICPNFGIYNGKLYCTHCALLAGCVNEAARFVTKVEWFAMHSGGSKVEAVCNSSDVGDDRGSGVSSTVSSTHEAVKSNNSSEASMNSVNSVHFTKITSSNKVDSGGSVEGNVTVACDVSCDHCDVSDSGASRSVRTHVIDKTSSSSSGSLNIVNKSDEITSCDLNSPDEGWTDKKTMGLGIHRETGASRSNKVELGGLRGRKLVKRTSAASYFTKSTSSDKKDDGGDSSGKELYNSGLQWSSPVRDPLGTTVANANALNVYKLSLIHI